jgi:hypothetical protein
MEYISFALGFITISLIAHLVRRKRIINFLIFCGTEVPEISFYKVVNPLLMIDLEFYNLSLVYYFNKIIRTKTGVDLYNTFRNLKKVKSLKKQQICQQAFFKSLSLAKPKKLAGFYVDIVMLSFTDDYQPEILSLILLAVKDLEDEAKYSFTSLLGEESLMLSFVSSKQNQILINTLNAAIAEIDQTKT